MDLEIDVETSETVERSKTEEGTFVAHVAVSNIETAPEADPGSSSDVETAVQDQNASAFDADLQSDIDAFVRRSMSTGCVVTTGKMMTEDMVKGQIRTYLECPCKNDLFQNIAELFNLQLELNPFSDPHCWVYDRTFGE